MSASLYLFGEFDVEKVWHEIEVEIEHFFV